MDPPIADSPVVQASTARKVSSSPDATHPTTSISDGAPASSSVQARIHEKSNILDGEELETEEARIERLGRQRPAKFKSLWAEIFFCYSILASQFMAVYLPKIPSLFGDLQDLTHRWLRNTLCLASMLYYQALL